MKGLTPSLDTPLKARVDLSRTGRELIMNHFRLFNSPNYTASAQSAMDNNNRHLDKAVRKFQEAFFPHYVPNMTFRGHVGVDICQPPPHDGVEEVEDECVYDDDDEDVVVDE